MTVKTSDLCGAQLDWAVAKAEGHQWRMGDHGLQFSEQGTSCWRPWRPTTDWSQGGPIIESELMKLSPQSGRWLSYGVRFPAACAMHGPTPLIAAMRCYVASKLGDEVDVSVFLPSEQEDAA